MKTEEKVKYFPSPTFLICRNVVIKTDEDNQYISADQESNVDAFLTQKIESYSWAGAVAMNHRDKPPQARTRDATGEKSGKSFLVAARPHMVVKLSISFNFPHFGIL